MRKEKVTIILIICLIILNILSLTSLFSALHQGGQLKNKDIFYKQLVWIGVFWVTVVIFSFINYRVYFGLAYPVYVLSILLLVGVKIFGKEIMGAQRWLSIMGFNFQPSEFAKISLLFLLSRIFSYNGERKYIFVRRILYPLFLVGIVAVLIFKQPDLGTALILVFMFFMIALAAGVKKTYVIGILFVGIVLLPLEWHMLKDYQKRRLAVFLNPNIDPLGAGYTIIQSKIAVGSGRFFGKGFLSGTQSQFNFLPERHTDFIFTVIAEEFGFVGCMFLLFIYYLIMSTILSRIKHVQDAFGKLLCVGIYSIIFLHLFINIGMTIGIVPVVGLPLLFLSYGGTHLLATGILMGIFLNINRQW